MVACSNGASSKICFPTIKACLNSTNNQKSPKMGNIYKRQKFNNKMRLDRKLLISFIASTTYLFSSFFFETIPCRVAPQVLNPQLSWNLCTINPNTLSNFGLQKVYFGISSNYVTSYIIAFLGAFVLVFLALSFKLRKDRAKNGDERR